MESMMSIWPCASVFRVYNLIARQKEKEEKEMRDAHSVYFLVFLLPKQDSQKQWIHTL